MVEAGKIPLIIAIEPEQHNFELLRAITSMSPTAIATSYISTTTSSRSIAGRNQKSIDPHFRFQHLNLIDEFVTDELKEIVRTIYTEDYKLFYADC